MGKERKIYCLNISGEMIRCTQELRLRKNLLMLQEQGY